MNQDKQPEALRLAEDLDSTSPQCSTWQVSAELRRLHARVQELEAEFAAAAPQPSEATCNQSMQPVLATKEAPEQLPDCRGRVMIDEDGECEIAWRGGFPPDDRTPIYTEHQVRQLLAAHGIK